MKTTIKVFALFAISCLLLLGFSSCESGVYGTGESYLYTPEVDDFDAISISLAADVDVEYSVGNRLDIWAQENIMDNMEIFVSNRTLHLKFDHHVRHHAPISITIGTPELEGIDLSGACDVQVLSPYIAQDFDVNISGANRLVFTDSIFCDNMDYHVSGTSSLEAHYLDVWDKFEVRISGFSETNVATLYCNELNYKVSGTGSSSFQGKCHQQSIRSSGTVRYSGVGFVSKQCDIDVSGTGYFDVFVEDEMSIDVSGKAKVNYKGQPTISSNSSPNLTITSID